VDRIELEHIVAGNRTQLDGFRNLVIIVIFSPSNFFHAIEFIRAFAFAPLILGILASPHIVKVCTLNPSTTAHSFPLPIIISCLYFNNEAKTTIIRSTAFTPKYKLIRRVPQIRTSFTKPWTASSPKTLTEMLN